jgi:hypothetical protein
MRPWAAAHLLLSPYFLFLLISLVPPSPLPARLTPSLDSLAIATGATPRPSNHCLRRSFTAPRPCL